MEFFNVVKATQKSGKQDAVVWFTAKTEARANLMLDVALEDAGIETGRGKDYAKPIRTDFPVYDDLPEEGAVDYTWCERYELQNDDRTWLPKVTAENSDEKTAQTVDSHITTESTLPETAGITLDEHDDDSTLYPVVQMPFRKQLLSQFTADELRHHVTREEYEAIGALEMDTDNSYVQNLLLAAENCPEVKGYDTKDLWRYTDAIRKVFSQDKRHELALVLRFTRMWAATDYIDRGILAREWAAGNHISSVQRTDSGTNANGGYVTDRGPDTYHTLDTLDLEIACALLPMDFNHFEIPGSILRRAKEIVTKKEEPWKSWSSILRNQPGVLGVNRTAIFNLIRIAPENIHLTPVAHLEFVNRTMTAEFNAATELMPLRASAVQTQVEVEEPTAQPQVANLGGGMFSINGLLSGNTNPVINIPSNEAEKPETVVETTSDVQMEATQPEKDKTVDTVPPGESADATDPQTDTLNPAEVLSAAAPELANATTQELTTEASEEKASAPEEQPSQPVPEYPAYFEPGRYEGLPNDVYHAANGISSTQVKDARVSLMYFNARHVAKTIPRAPSKVLDMGNLVHALALQPENLEAEFSVEPEIPEDAFTTTATLREFIDSHNASLPAQLSADDIKALLDEYNATLPALVPLGASLDETAQNYMALPAEFQRIDADQKKTATAMKACIKEYNATLPAQIKTSGSRDALLEQLAIINPDLVAQEAQKLQPLKVSGTKADLIQAVKAVKPDAVFADELLDAWRNNPEGKVLVTHQQLATAQAIQSALLSHPTAGMLLTHPSRAVEVSYFGFDEETGLEVRVRPDLEIDLDGVRIGADLKTISMWNVKQESLRARLHREIIERDYHLSAAMYCETAALDQFFWIFVNKDENYHWIAIIEASAELLELGMLEYRKAMRNIATGFDTGEWPAPITADYTDELNDFDLRRLEALRTQA